MANYDSTVLLNACSLTDNSASENGGAIYNSGGLTLMESCAFERNSTTGVFTSGGAAYNNGSQASFSSCTFLDNSATGHGGAIYHGQPGDGSLNVSNCTFEENEAEGNGGAVYNQQGVGAQVISSIFRNNHSARNGGALYNQQGDQLIIRGERPFDTMFSGNSATERGGAVYNQQASGVEIRRLRFTGNTAGLEGGALYNQQGPTSMINSLFSGNGAELDGGACYEINGTTKLINCSFSQNTAGGVGGGIFVFSQQGELTVVNSVLWGNADQGGVTEFSQVFPDNADPVINYSFIQGLSGELGGEGNIGAEPDDPAFIDPDGDDDLIGTQDDDLRLSAGSPCIDAGDRTAVPGGITEDLDDKDRFRDDPQTPNTGLGTPPVDMGAFEFQGE